MKFFSTERANALIPRIAPLVDELLTKRRDLAIALLESEAGGSGRAANVVAPRLAQPRSTLPPLRFGERKSEIVRLIQRIESFGCVVKDLNLGLIDFPSVREGTQIMLCWKAGEPAVSYWHALDEGFHSRHPIES